jgi:FlaA1/EpsC-like NDP-sugar epimerase
MARHRHLSGPVFDAFSWAIAISLATYLRFQFDVHRSFTRSLLVVIGLAIIAQWVVGLVPLYRVRWKIGSFEQIAVLSAVLAITTGVLLLSSLLFFRRYVPVGAVIASGAFALILTVGARCGWRLYREYQQLDTDDVDRVIVFGAGEGGRQVIDALVNSEGAALKPVCLLDDDPKKQNLQVRHLRVRGDRDSITDASVRFRAKELIIAIPSADSVLMRDLSALALAAGLRVRVLPPVSQLLALEVDISDIRPLTEADLLGRRTIDTNVESIAEYLTGRRVLVTGAGGSIGTELCRQVHRYSPSELVMLDRDESGLHQVQLVIEGSAMLDTRSLVVCDIRDVDALRAVFFEHQPEVVFHAAALKHLPLLEMWPAEAVKTNVLGTLNLLNVAAEFGVTRFVNISTDKAADPISVLGYTKRLAERLTATIGQRVSGEFISVRFGNVLGSRGSFLTTFRAQVDAGGPVTVTDPDVTRYFMTVEEAVQLVIQAGALGTSGKVLILDMGTPVRVAEVAEQLIAQSGRPMPIAYTGLRPGEKLHEILLSLDDSDRLQLHPLIISAKVPEINEGLVNDIDLLASPQDLRSALSSYCRTVAHSAGHSASPPSSI